MASYRISPNAADDLERIWFYGLENWGLDAADEYYAGFFLHFEQLAKQPLSYPVSHIREGYRRGLYGKDSVFYRINGETVEIMAIIGQQDAALWL